ncbi:MAG: hypothetical protein H0V82_09675 [Candidatus Protochlamydia sp.]|nr:hypothetical protein [Candidatus Protochlamydia sp.]
MKVTEKIFSITPYISTTWSQIAALHMKGSNLAVTLVDGDTILIPNLSPETITLIFQHHSMHLEKEQPPVQVQKELFSGNQVLKELLDPQGEPGFRMTFGPLDGLNTALQHNPSQANAPDLPPEIIQKIGAIAHIIAPSDEASLPQPELFCNCFHCQIARAINASTQPISGQNEEQEVVTEDDLNFQEWSITQTGTQLFSVTHRLDALEKYNVFLGDPVGCTCGIQGCEHILAVLKS